jgi:hypothetical protein
MRIELGLAAALALSAIAVPSAVQARDYHDRGYSYGHGHDRYDRHSWREHRRWERERERQHRRWLREHRHHHDRYWNPYR